MYILLVVAEGVIARARFGTFTGVVEVEVTVPAVTCTCFTCKSLPPPPAASKAGAPVSQDFSIISLSDRLTDINLIDKRVKAALDCDFVIGIYNPKSKKRILPYQNFMRALKSPPAIRVSLLLILLIIAVSLL